MAKRRQLFSPNPLLPLWANCVTLTLPDLVTSCYRRLPYSFLISGLISQPCIIQPVSPCCLCRLIRRVLLRSECEELGIGDRELWFSAARKLVTYLVCFGLRWKGPMQLKRKTRGFKEMWGHVKALDHPTWASLETGFLLLCRDSGWDPLGSSAPSHSGKCSGVHLGP